MKKSLLSLALIFGAITFIGAGCASAATPLTEVQQAEEQGISLEEYKEVKEAAARMNMTAEEHMKMSRL